MDMWILLKRIYYRLLYSKASFATTPFEREIVSAVASNLPGKEAATLLSQLECFEYIQRLHKGRIVVFYFGRDKGPLLWRTDTQFCLAEVSLRTANKRIIANVVCFSGRLGMIQYRRAPEFPATIDSITLLPEKYVDVEKAVGRATHGKEDV